MGRRFALRTLVGVAIGIVVWLWIRTLRVRVVGRAALEHPGPLVCAFWHGKQMSLLRWPRRRGSAVLVSLSADGDLQVGVMRTLGLHVVRGSSSRGGSSGFKGLVRAQRRRGADVVFAVDGPRGPAGRVKPGAAELARLCGAPLLPLGVASSASWVLRRTWDRFELPRPFARVVIVAGPLLDPGASSDALGRALSLAERHAADRVHAGAGPLVGKRSERAEPSGESRPTKLA